MGQLLRAKVRTTFQSLAERNYRLFAAGQLTKQLGVWIQFVAQDWLVLDLTDNSASALGLITGIQFLPVVLLSLYGGKLADRYDKRRLLVWTNACYFALGLVMGVLVSTGVITLALVFVVAALMGVVNAIENPLRQSFISELVERPLLPNALGLASAAFNTARIVGPALAGVAIWAVGLGPVFLVTSAFYLAPLVFLLQMRPAELHGVRTVGSRERDGARIRDGLTYVWQRPDLRLPLALLLLVGMCGFNFQLTLSVLAKNVYGTGAEQFGLLTTALASGALAGALVSGGRRTRPGVYAVIGSAVVFGTLEILVGLAPTFWATALLLVPTGFAMVFYAQATNQRMQLGVTARFRGRVMALFTLVFLGTTPVGGPLVGFVSEHAGPRVGVWGGGLVCLLAALGALAWHLHESGERLRVALHPLPRFEVIPAATDEAPALVNVR